MKKEIIGSCTLLQADALEIMPTLGGFDLVLADPPFDMWRAFEFPEHKTLMAFTNWQNREKITEGYGSPRIEIIWYFEDGRWVSPNMPRITHESILIYGPTGDASCGESNPDVGTAQRKGDTSIGKDRIPGRVYRPKERKQLNSVQCFPRNVAGGIGVWGKPEPLIHRLIEFSGAESVLDPFMGGGVAGAVCAKLGIPYVGIEINENHFEQACERVRQAHKQPSLFEPQAASLPQTADLFDELTAA